MLALRNERADPEAVLTLRKAGKTQVEYLKITIENGRVTSLVIEGGDPSGGPDVSRR